MTDVNLLLLHSNTQNHLTVCKQMIKSKLNDSYLMKILEIICEEKWAQTYFKILLAKSYIFIIKSYIFIIKPSKPTNKNHLTVCKQITDVKLNCLG